MAKKGSKNVKTDALKPRAEKFADTWVENGGNGTKAAEAAGYAPGASAAVAASRLLRNDKVKAHIQARLEDSHIRNNEILGTLAAFMRGDLADVLPDNPILKAAKDNGYSNIIKKATVKKYFDKGLNAQVEETTVEIHDALAAAKYLAKVRGMEQLPRENDADHARRRQGYHDVVESIYQRAVEAGEEVTRADVARRLIARKPEAEKYIDLTEYTVA
jgi:phage terminase small subunit